MHKHSLLAIILLLALLSACTSNAPTNTLTQTFTLIPTKTNTSLPSPTITLTPTPAQISLDSLPSGLYIVISSYELDQQLILDLEGNLVGVFLDFFAYGGIINSQNSVLAYITDSAAISRKRPELFDYPIGLYDLETDEVIPIEFDEGYRADGRSWTWSPDGTKLIFIDWCPGCGKGWGSDHRLGVIDLNKNSYARINLGEGYVLTYAADWSPDGKWIAFATRIFTGELSIYTGYYEMYLMDTSCLDQVETCKDNLKLVFSEKGMNYTDPFWFPDNQHLFFICNDEEDFFEWCIGDVTTGEITIMPNKPKYGSYPNLSPDGEWIAYINNYHYGLYILPINGTESRLIAESDDFYSYFWLTIP